MKVVFLDIDGVLNSVRSCIAYDGYPWQGDSDEEREWHKFDQVAIALLRVCTIIHFEIGEGRFQTPRGSSWSSYCGEDKRYSGG